MDSKRITTDCPMVDHLPEAIFFEIMLKLPIKRLLMCKFVCKSWRDLISDARFAKLHFAQSKPCTLIRNRHTSHISRALYLLEPEAGGDFGSKYFSCERSNTVCNISNHIAEVETSLKIPLRNTHLLLKSFDSFASMVLEVRGRKISARLNSTAGDHAFGFIRSCNGLLCLSNVGSPCIVVCNPVTGEFINLPELSNYKDFQIPQICFGFGPKTGQYKVLRLFWPPHETLDIHTLGTRTWRRIGPVPSEWHLSWRACSPIHFNGVIHWFCSDEIGNHSGCMACFDLEEERFRSPIPLPLGLSKKLNSVAMAVLGGQLCVYDRVNCDMNIWAMEEYGVAESWTRLVTIKISSEPGFKPLSRSSDGGFMMEGPGNSLVYSHPSLGLRIKRVKSPNASKFEAIAHTPSFLSLKDLVDTSAVEVFNVNSGCGKIKLMEESSPVFLGCAENVCGDAFLPHLVYREHKGMRANKRRR